MTFSSVCATGVTYRCFLFFFSSIFLLLVLSISLNKLLIINTLRPLIYSLSLHIVLPLRFSQSIGVIAWILTLAIESLQQDRGHVFLAGDLVLALVEAEAASYQQSEG